MAAHRNRESRENKRQRDDDTSSSSASAATEEIILDCSGEQKEGTLFGDDKGLILRKIKYDFQVIRVECRVKWKFTPASAGEDVELTLKCGKKKRKGKDSRAILTLASCGKSSLETAFVREPDKVHPIWQKKKAGTFYFKICICL